MRAFFAAIVIACALAAAPARSQSLDKHEVGGQVTAMRLSGIDATDAGIGARVTWNLNPALALEGVTDFFPTGRFKVVRGGRKVNALFGLKEGWRADRVGAFVKTRAGLSRVAEGRAKGICILIFPPPEACYVGETRLAFDIGGVFEVYPSRRSTVRLDVGDLATRLTDSSYRFGQRGRFAHDLQIAAGAGVRW